MLLIPSNNGKRMEIVTGTGRSGTSAFMKLLIELGDVSPSYFNHDVRAGYEEATTQDLKAGYQASKVVKNPRFFFEMSDLCDSIRVSHVYLCVRDVDQVIGSRLAHEGLVWSEWGDVKGEGSNDSEKMRNFIEKGYSSFFSEVAKRNISITILRYPHFLLDPSETWNQLKRSPIAMRYTKADIFSAYKKAIDTSIINQYGEKN